MQICKDPCFPQEQENNTRNNLAPEIFVLACKLVHSVFYIHSKPFVRKFSNII
uniref:Uncharacterized protein n=1 Tax=Anguilla anguilla TaxID=7936 RepID=A0A0E9PLK4_ANGAN